MRRREELLSRADLIAHPVRLRIIMTVAGQELTPQQIAAVLADVPQASLYRHIRRLADAGVLTVVRETPVRGTVEKVYALAEGGGRIGDAKMASASPEDHLRYFTTFFAAFLSWLRSYLQQERIDPKKDGLTCRGATLYLSDAEYQQLFGDIGKLLQPLMGLPLTPERRRRVVGWIAVPERRDHPEAAEPAKE